MRAGTEIPVVTLTPDAIDLFAFSASAWLIHRIHYDVPFTTEHDGHPGLLVHGPLQGAYMVRAVHRWLGRRARLRSITYRHLAPAYLGDTLDCGGTVIEVEDERVTMELWIRKGDTITTTGAATFEVSE
jgi:hydroxyacyl-ACP dehydratase HTD2-like protein with hotdog domain